MMMMNMMGVDKLASDHHEPCLCTPLFLLVHNLPLAMGNITLRIQPCYAHGRCAPWD